MTWRQFVRAVERDSRRRQREQHRAAVRGHRQADRLAVERHRELKAYQKQINAQNEKAQAAHDVAQFQNYLELLVSLHKDCGEVWDWESYKNAPPPSPPVAGHRNEESAAHALNSYVPGFFEKLFGGAKKRVALLEREVARARAVDQDEHAKALRAHAEARKLGEWQRDLATTMLRGDVSAYSVALEHAEAFEDLVSFKIRASVQTAETGVIAIVCELSDEEVVPNEEVKLTATGKLSSKAMPAGKYWSIYQDFVCSTALRAAAETFAVVPIDRVIVNVGAVQTNGATGHREFMTFLAVHFSRATLGQLNLGSVDPSESMKNFPHRMKFKKTSGFDAIAPITAREQWISS